MRMRNKPWAGPELDACPFFIRNPQQQRGAWHDWFGNGNPLHLELGCGKGFFIAGAAPQNPGINYLGIDLKDVVLAPAKRKIESAFDGAPVDNVALTAFDIERLALIMNERDTVERIYINFCNPWPRPRHKKRRLTYPTRLAEYKKLLSPGGERWFKTDDDGLFHDTIQYVKDSGFMISALTYDLPLEPLDGVENFQTEHELMFREKGIPIKALRACPIG